jgi:hypothetical protein
MGEQTIFAQAAAPASSGTLRESDRRREPRQAVLLRATLFAVDDVVEIRVRNASATGLMAEADVELSVGQAVHIAVDNRYFRATVRWTEGRRLGMQLQNALAIVAPEKIAQPCGDDELRSALRVDVDVVGQLYVSRPPRCATIRNLSRTGMRINAGPGFRPGQMLIVAAAERSAVLARVQWAHGSLIGVKHL